jgi:glycosyltransferase involved in cell wall biosynthesis
MPVDVSIVIPVYSEEGILREAVTELIGNLAHLRAELGAPELTFEVILAENGSRDRTAELAQHLADEIPEVTTFSLGEPNYGKALRRGILEARGIFVICDEIDLCDRITALSSCCATAIATWWSAARR